MKTVLYQLAINGNRDTDQNSVLLRVLKDIVSFQQEFPAWEFDAKSDPIGLLESDKKSDS